MVAAIENTSPALVKVSYKVFNFNLHLLKRHELDIFSILFDCLPFLRMKLREN